MAEKLWGVFYFHSQPTNIFRQISDQFTKPLQRQTFPTLIRPHNFSEPFIFPDPSQVFAASVVEKGVVSNLRGNKMNNSFELYAAVVGLWLYLFFGVLIVAWWVTKSDR